MALDFTTIKDQPGTAVFLLHDGSTMGQKDMEELAENLRGRTQKQIILLDSTETIGRSIIDFYQLNGSKFVLLVQDDDQLYHVWSDGETFDPSQIVYMLEQAS